MLKETSQKLMAITKKSYEKIAGDFSSTRNFSWLEIDETIEKYLKDDIKILDLGCGNGRLLLSLKKYLNNFDYTGLDSCQALITKAQASFTSSQLSSLSLSFSRKLEPKNINFIHGDILDLSQFVGQQFDVVFMVASFNHIPSQELREKLLLDIKIILKPDGVLIMTNWNLWRVASKKSAWTYWIKSRFSFLSSRALTRDPEYLKIISGFQILPRWQTGMSGMTFRDVLTFWQNQFPLYYHAFTPRELKKLLQKTNLEVLENYYVNNGKKTHWFNGKNILTVARKI